MASEVATRAPAAQECRKCRYARTALRAAVYMAVGVIVALALSWAVRAVPVLGVVLGFVSTLLLAKTLLSLFFRPSPAKALLHLGVSFALGLAVAALVASMAGLVG